MIFFALFFKALQEFQEVCSLPSNESEPCLTSKEGVLLILPYWPRLYTRLANDTDRRVREATQKAHLVGKETEQLPTLDYRIVVGQRLFINQIFFENVDEKKIKK